MRARNTDTNFPVLRPWQSQLGPVFSIQQRTCGRRSLTASAHSEALSLDLSATKGNSGGNADIAVASSRWTTCRRRPRRSINSFRLFSTQRLSLNEIRSGRPSHSHVTVNTWASRLLIIKSDDASKEETSRFTISNPVAVGWDTQALPREMLLPERGFFCPILTLVKDPFHKLF